MLFECPQNPIPRGPGRGGRQAFLNDQHIRLHPDKGAGQPSQVGRHDGRIRLARWAAMGKPPDIPRPDPKRVSGAGTAMRPPSLTTRSQYVEDFHTKTSSRDRALMEIRTRCPASKALAVATRTTSVPPNVERTMRLRTKEQTRIDDLPSYVVADMPNLGREGYAPWPRPQDAWIQPLVVRAWGNTLCLFDNPVGQKTRILLTEVRHDTDERQY